MHFNFSNHPAGRRQRLDRRRLETAHFRYALLVVASWYSADIPMPKFLPDLNLTLLEFTPLYHKAFHSHYSGLSCPKLCMLLCYCAGVHMGSCCNVDIMIIDMMSCSASDHNHFFITVKLIAVKELAVVQS